jgi:glycosidase
MKSRPYFALVCFLAALSGAGFSTFAQEPDPAIASLQARPSPAWLKSGIVYQIFVRSFSPAGDLNGVTARLDDLHTLGVNILWLMPIHPDGQVKKKGSLGSPYAVRDYYAIDPAIGTKDDLHRLVQEAHKRQMKVILDMVANHTAWDSVMMAQPEYYKKDKEGHVTYPYDWTDVAALDYSNPKLRRYMTDVLLSWVKDFDIDGYRCDAAAEVPTDFWEQARKELDQAKPDILMLAEAQKPELLRSAFDIDYA